MTVRQCDKSDKNVWDEFVSKSKNGTFLFLRNYMDYHEDRFMDNSLIICDSKDKIMAVLPANIKDNTLHSHGGLTYGGFITDDKMTTPVIVEVYDKVIDYLKKIKISKLFYKTIPYIYHKTPAEEDRYQLFL